MGAMKPCGCAETVANDSSTTHVAACRVKNELQHGGEPGIR